MNSGTPSPPPFLTSEEKATTTIYIVDFEAFCKFKSQQEQRKKVLLQS